MKYLTHGDIFYKYQSGFQEIHSTDTSFSYLRDKILTGFDAILLTGMIIINLQKVLTI